MSERERGDKEKDKEKEGKLLEMLKKITSTGLGAAFMTEEVVRGILSDLPLPKELLTNLVQGAKSTKEEFLASVKNGVQDYLDQIDFRKEMGKILENYDFEVKAKISIKKKNPGHSSSSSSSEEETSPHQHDKK